MISTEYDALGLREEIIEEKAVVSGQEFGWGPAMAELKEEIEKIGDEFDAIQEIKQALIGVTDGEPTDDEPTDGDFFKDEPTDDEPTDGDFFKDEPTDDEPTDGDFFKDEAVNLLPPENNLFWCAPIEKTPGTEGL